MADGDVLQIVAGHQTFAPGSGGGGSISATDGVVTVDPATSIRVTKVAESSPGEATLVALPDQWAADAKGNLSVHSDSTPDDGDPLLTLHATGEDIGGGHLTEINSDGQADYYFQDGQVGGPIFFDFWSTDPVGTVVRISTEGLEVTGVLTAQNSRAGGPAVYLSGLPTSEPHSAGQVYSNGVPSAGVPKALMVSGG